MENVTIASLHDLKEEVARLLQTLARKEGATLITLSGDLGAGKTAFVKEIASALGVEERVTSPTFVIMKIYDLVGQKFDRLVHIDAYRLKGEKHLKVLGWDDLLKDSGNLICMEWPEQVALAEHVPAIRISLRLIEGGAREITYK